MAYSITADSSPSYDRPGGPRGSPLTPALGLACPNSGRVEIDTDAAIFVQLGDGWPASIWRNEFPVNPGNTRQIDGRVDAVRVRSAVAGTPATVTITALPIGELGELFNG